MGDLQSPRLMYFKGGLLLAIGCLAAIILLMEHRSVRFALLLAVAIWSFARSYYFAFYVIEHYIDPGYRYAGLVSFSRYLISGKRPTEATMPWRRAEEQRPSSEESAV